MFIILSLMKMCLTSLSISAEHNQLNYNELSDRIMSLNDISKLRIDNHYLNLMSEHNNHTMLIGNNSLTLNRNIIDIGRIKHNGKPKPGSAYGYVWEQFGDGVKLTCETVVAMHLIPTKEHDRNSHGFPDMGSKILLDRVREGDNIEYWDGEKLRSASVKGQILITGIHGSRTIWGLVPAFSANCTLSSGSPIFKNGKLVSVITKSNGNGLYAISTRSENSGHMNSHRVRVRKALPGQSVYGKVVDDYQHIKAEAIREKTNKTGEINVEIILLDNTIRIVQWCGDNYETMHIRTPAYNAEIEQK